MIKVTTWFKRTPGMALDDFRRYWREEHPKAVLQLPGLRKYVQNHVTDHHYRDGAANEPLADGVAETWWDDRDALAAHRGTEALDALLEDEGHFIDPDHRDQFVAQEVVINPLGIPVDGLKQIIFVKRRSGMAIDDALRHWQEVHGPLALQAPGLGRYVQSHTLAHQYRDGRPEPTYDGATSVWFADAD
ncbi:MAG: EthD family reductase, partial [Actinomycetota bacterium]